MGAAPKPTAALFYAYTQPRAEGGLGLSPLGVGQLRAGGALARAAGLALHGAALTTSRPARIIGPAAWAGAALASLQTAALSPAAARLLLPALQMGVTVGSSLALAAVVRVSGIAALGAAAELSSAASGALPCCALTSTRQHTDMCHHRLPPLASELLALPVYAVHTHRSGMCIAALQAWSPASSACS